MSFFSPVNQARWARFRHNRRGYWSLWIFLALFACSLCAELIANDKPLLVQYRGSLYVPLLKNYSETTFGGSFATAADYQDPWLQKRLDDNGWALWAPVRFGATTIISPPTRPSLRRRQPRTGWAPMPTAETCWREFSTVRAFPFSLVYC